MSQTIRRSLFLLLLGFAFVSCSGGPTSPSETSITGITWKLRSIQRSGGPTINIPQPERFTLTFGEDLRVAMRADCNVCTGGYELTGSTLKLGLLACTKAYCGVDSPDTEFLKGLEVPVSVSRSGGILKLSAGGTVLTFEE
jgi:heat shock protein HslJ